MKKYNIILISLILIFILITILVCNNKLLEIDQKIYEFIISFKTKNLTNFFKMITKAANVKFCILFLFSFLIIFRNKDAIFMIITAIDIEILNLLMKAIIQRDRPNILRLILVDNYSYPSGHAMISMGIYGFLIYLLWVKIKNKYIKYIGIVLLSVLIILIGTSRIYLGVHYFSDVVSGYILSIIYLMIFIKIINIRGIFNVQTNSK